MLMPGIKNIQYTPLVAYDKIILLHLHYVIGLMKNWEGNKSRRSFSHTRCEKIRISQLNVLYGFNYKFFPHVGTPLCGIHVSFGEYSKTLSLSLTSEH